MLYGLGKERCEISRRRERQKSRKGKRLAAVVGMVLCLVATPEKRVSAYWPIRLLTQTELGRRSGQRESMEYRDTLILGYLDTLYYLWSCVPSMSSHSIKYLQTDWKGSIIGFALATHCRILGSSELLVACAPQAVTISPFLIILKVSTGSCEQ